VLRLVVVVVTVACVAAAVHGVDFTALRARARALQLRS